MKDTAYFNCIIIGDDHLTLMCAEMTIKCGQALVAVISAMPHLKRWAAQNHIPWFAAVDDFLRSTVAQQPIDYLLSIVHLKLLSPAILKIPKKFSINYHDALLPQYAGLHATSWALLYGEEKHGITWHVITEEVDAGPILIQKEFPISETETAFSLNLKCHQAALNTFEVLITALSENNFTLTPQNIAQRTYFGRYHPIPHNGLIHWQTLAQNIERLCRAVNFGEAENTLGSAKFLVGETWYLIEKCTLQAASGQKPGVISMLENNFLQIATLSEDVRLIAIRDQLGTSIPISVLIKQHQLGIGKQLPIIESHAQDERNKLIITARKNENYWHKKLQNLDVLEVPFLTPTIKNKITNTHASLLIAPELLYLLTNLYQDVATEVVLCAAIFAFFYRLYGAEQLSTAFSHPALPTFENTALNTLFSSQVPCTLSFSTQDDFTRIMQTLEKEITTLTQRGSFQKDIFARLPEMTFTDLPVSINLLENFSMPAAAKSGLLNFTIDLTTHALHLVFPAALIEIADKINAHFVCFLSSLCAAPHKKIIHHTILPEREQHKLMLEWSSGQFICLEDYNVPQLIEQQAVKNFNKTAVIFNGTPLSYAELNRRANQLAHFIQKKNIQRSTLIGVYLDRSFEMVVVLLAILKSGNTYIPLDITAPKTILENIIADANIAWVITKEPCPFITSGTNVNLIALDVESKNLSKEEDTNLPAVSQNTSAYVMYTSGSTGKPKGVAITHRALVNFLLGISQTIKFNQEDILLAITPITFDISGLELYLPLITGAQLVLATNEERLNPHYLIEHIKKYQVGFLQATPATWQMLLNAGWSNTEKVTMLSGGESLSVQLATQLFATGATLWNLYGPTEATIWSTACEVTHIDETKPSIPIGRPLPNTQVYVLDKNLQPTPVEIYGTLYIAGDGLASGYLHQLQLTEKQFIQNPFSTNPESKIYNTGDQVKWLSDGTLFCSGRLDSQIKIRGFRVEIGEIETAIRSFPGVQQTVVIFNTTALAHAYLVAYVVPEPEAIFSKKDLAQYLKNRLQEHMIPAYFVTLNMLPLSTNGKVNKKALPTPTLNDLYNKKKFIPPVTKEQKLLAEIWSQVLGIPTSAIGLEDNFFELGGHSLLALQVLTRIQSLFFTELNIRAIFDFPTIKQLAELILASPKSKLNSPLLSSVKERQPQLLSYNQMRLWFFNELYGHSAIYNVSVAWRLQGNLDIHALTHAMTTVIKRQGVLRTIFLSANGKPQQILQPANSVNFTLEIENVHSPSSDIINNTLENLAALPFQLEGEYLFRFRLLKTGDNDHILFLCLHHLIADAWSFGILYRELCIAYQAHTQNIQPLLPTVTAQYVDFCVWQHTAYNERLYKKQIDYWKTQLAGIPALALPIDRPRPAVQSWQGSSIHFKIPAENTNRLQLFSQQQQVTLFTTLISAFAILLNKYTQQSDIVIGIPVANRNLQAIENLIGFFVNTLAIRFDLAHAINFIELSRAAQNTILDAQKNGEVPFEKIIDVLQPERDQSRSPIFQVMFAFNNTKDTALHLPQIQTTPLEIRSSYARFEMTFFLEEKEGDIAGYVEYNKNLFDEQTIAQLIKHYLAILTNILSCAKQPIHHFNFLDAAEKQELLFLWNNTFMPYPTDQTVSHIFEAQAEVHAKKVALIHQNHMITYDVLNRSANKLARWIQQHCPCTGLYLTLYCERNIDMLVALLAAMKTGHIYVPIDKNLAPDLIGEILEDCHATAMITTEALAKNITEIARNLDVKIIMLDADARLITQMDDNNLGERISSNSLAYVMYTSGSTGKPKGVEITHRALINFLWGIGQTIKFNQEDTLLAITPITFDISGLELYLPLITGAQLVLATNEERLNPHCLIEHMKKYQVRFLQATPVTWQMLLNTGWKNTEKVTMLCGGESLSVQLATQLFATGATLWNLYGPTETTIWSTAYKVTHIDETKPSIPIGCPLPNTQVYVLDANLQPTPIGVPGELYIAGDGIAHGYLNQAELTTQKFLPNPFAAQTGETFYKTGDLVVWSHMGALQHIGRIDTQIKIRGHRIETSSIESLLVQHEHIKEAVVLDTTPTQTHELVAYITLKQNVISPQKVQEYLRQSLPNYMIPTKFIAVETLPLTPNGKIDRKAIPKLKNLRHLTDALLYNAPIQNNHEALMIEIIKKLLNLAAVDPETNFFNLGMHSLLMIEFSYLLNKALNRTINVIDLFTYPSVRTFAQFLTQDTQTEESNSVTERSAAKRSRKVFKSRGNYD